MQQRTTRAQTNLNNMSIRPATWGVCIKIKGRSFCLALSDKSKKNANKFELFTLSQQSRAIPSIVWWKHSRRKDQSDCHALWKLRKRGVIIESLVDHLMDLQIIKPSPLSKGTCYLSAVFQILKGPTLQFFYSNAHNFRLSSVSPQDRHWALEKIPRWQTPTTFSATV